ncbi:MAG: hypothetical protein GX552_03475 [Chloroflexi bacterium]|jgi:hypothetical protein|nr:hypothetical protein [Chloroflexota bacterium]
MAKTEERVYRMNLDDFHRYLGDKHREIQACYKEIEEVQYQFNDIFKRELDAWQDKFSYCYPRVVAQRSEMPPAFARLIDKTEQEERARIQREIADLEQAIRAGQAKMDDLLAKSQQSLDDLRGANPELNEAEERLKAEMVRLEDEYADAFEQLDSLDTFPFGWLTHMGKIRRLKRIQRDAKRKQGEVYKQLAQVRHDWQKRLEEAGETQGQMRAEWQQESIKVSEAQGRLDHLTANLDALAEQAAIQRVLEELTEPPAVSGELGEALAELVQRNHVRWSYEQGLRAVAEALGITKGVGEGMQRFQRSVSTVLQEQRRYNLAQVKVPLPGSAAVLNETWKELAARVKDDKYMGMNPVEFSQIIDGYVKERLTDAKIQALFEDMGEALNEATKAWK